MESESTALPLGYTPVSFVVAGISSTDYIIIPRYAWKVNSIFCKGYRNILWIRKPLLQKIKKSSFSFETALLVGVEGFEPSEWWSQSPLPYRLATPQFIFCRLYQPTWLLYHNSGEMSTDFWKSEKRKENGICPEKSNAEYQLYNWNEAICSNFLQFTFQNWLFAVGVI